MTYHPVIREIFAARRAQGTANDISSGDQRDSAGRITHSNRVQAWLSKNRLALSTICSLDVCICKGSRCISIIKLMTLIVTVPGCNQVHQRIS